MKKILTLAALIIPIFILAAFSFNTFSEENEVPYPEGYRYWVHIKTTLTGPENPSFKINGGYHHIYANTKAMQGYTSGNFPEGSIIVFDVLGMKEQKGNILEDSRTHIDVMLKDSLKFASTGGWGYEEFKGDSHTERSLTLTTKTQCFNCHTQKDDYVFSEFRK